MLAPVLPGLTTASASPLFTSPVATQIPADAIATELQGHIQTLEAAIQSIVTKKADAATADTAKKAPAKKSAKKATAKNATAEKATAEKKES